MKLFKKKVSSNFIMEKTLFKDNMKNIIITLDGSIKMLTKGTISLFSTLVKL